MVHIRRSYENSDFLFYRNRNSLFAAKRLQELIKGDVELISIPKAIKEGNLNFNYERVGFSFPLYFIGLPEIVERFIKETTFNSVKYSFVLTTSGMTPGFTGKQVEALLSEKGIKLNLNKWIYFTSNYIKKLKIQPKEKTDEKLAKNEVEIKSFAQEINSEVTKKIQSKSLLKLIGSGFYKEYRSSIDKASNSFSTTTKCDLCGVCSKVCPMDNIKVDSKVNWGSSCQDCVACIHHCPKEAIEIVGTTEGRRRYINPEVSIKEIINANS